MRVSLELEATAPDGFSEQVVRTVRENGTTLGFANNDFDGNPTRSTPFIAEVNYAAALVWNRDRSSTAYKRTLASTINECPGSRRHQARRVFRRCW